MRELDKAEVNVVSGGHFPDFDLSIIFLDVPFWESPLEHWMFVNGC